jgi:hypothetical protein
MRKSKPNKKISKLQVNKIKALIIQKLDLRKYYKDRVDIKNSPNDRGNISAICPFHDDTDPSLSINIKTGRYRCWGACDENGSIFKFHKKLNKLKTFKEAIDGLSKIAGVPIKREIVARYDYVDEQGEVQYEARKYNDKSFIPYRKIPDGGFKSGLEGVDKIPYNLPDLINSTKVYICEGEKDADNLAEKLSVLTTTFFGANWSDEYAKWFNGKIIRILPDNDEAGIAFAQKVAAGLYNIAKSIRIVILPGLETKGDVTDWLDNGGTKTDLNRLCRDTDNWDPSQVKVPKFVAELNEKHAFIMIEGKSRILNEIVNPSFNRPDINFSSIPDFVNKYYNKKVIDPETGNKTSSGRAWLNSPFRDSYEGIVFEPSNDVPGFYNLWRGLAVKPKKSDWSLFKRHILEIIADGDTKLAKWILAWMARIVQDPGGARPGTSIVLKGGQGIGKGVFATQFGALFGPHFLHLSNRIQITGRFNSHLKNALVVFGDEVTWGGEKKTAGILKAMVTEDTIQCEPKGIDSYTVKNRMNLIIASNSDWVVPAEIDERRFCVIRVSEDKKQNRKYFTKIISQMDSGGREAMLYDLLKRDISKINLRKIPRTEALIDQIERGLGIVERYWFDRLKEGTTVGLFLTVQQFTLSMGINGKNILIDAARTYADKWLRRVVTQILYLDFLGFQKNLRAHEDIPINHFIRNLRKVCPGIVTKQKAKLIMCGDHEDEGYCTAYKKRFNGIKIPALDKCREQFEAKIGSDINWEL